MGAPRVLFVNQAGVMSGAEYVLASLTVGWKDASAFLLEGGPLEDVLRRQGIDVAVASGAKLGTIKRDQSLFAALPLVARLLSLVRAIAAAARQKDVVYANSQKAFLLSGLASFLVRRPLIWHLHDIMDSRHFGTMQRRMQVTLANMRAACVIVPSQAAADAFAAAGGRAGSVRVVPNGITLDQPPTLDRASLGLPQGPLIGVFSRLAPWKGQHVVLEALEALPGVHCIIVGSALFGEDEYRNRLIDMVGRAGLADRVHFLGQRADVASLMQTVDVVVHPSVDPEPFGLTLVEAMRAGTPVIATDAGASAEILDGGKAGTLVAAGDAIALAEALSRFFENREPFRERAIVGKQRVNAVYDIVTMRQTVSGIVAKVAAA
ncbi:glycosyltransferase family 4 protein [Rhizobium tumorigenes]|uniref:glycosyltransferase family 4 protein n=1 Tax=Rhizobium tumorigenes TaxID=2041385 RepID=UPI00241D5A17|nr:glycosyltransferase family 4 protein [Rhizobium tumorigenes]WFS04264.1 glycosyltransferase family 4 protein [Rhizobium tumorigenes]